MPPPARLRRPLLRTAVAAAAGTLAATLAMAPAVAASAQPAPPAPEQVVPLAPPTTAPGAPAPPPVASRTWLVADLETGEVLGEQGGRIPLPMASTLKILTALALLPALDKAATYTATDADAAVEGSKVGLFRGGTYTVDQLFQALLLGSGNDAARALGELGGGQAATVARMNAVAAELGATDTRAVGTSGLDEPGQVTTAFDLALLARAALARPDFAAYVATTRVAFPGRDGTTYEVANSNQLLGRYPGAFGVKSGFTSQALRTIVGAAGRDGRRVVVVVLGTRDPTADVAAALLDWGFAVLATPGRRTGRLGTLLAPTSTPTSTPTAGTPTAGNPTGAPTGSGPETRIGPPPTAAADPPNGTGSSGDLPGWAWAAVPAAALAAAGAGWALRLRSRPPPAP